MAVNVGIMLERKRLSFAFLKRGGSAPYMVRYTVQGEYRNTDY
jgi:hypothetical protein